MRERSRRKPVDEEDTKLGRWVSHIVSNELRATVLWIYICIMRYSFWDTIFGYTSTIYRISFILLHMYFTLCFASLALLYHVIELCTRHWTFVHSSEQVFFFSLYLSSSFFLDRRVRILPLPLVAIIWLDLNARVEDFSCITCTILRAPLRFALA